MYTVYKHTNKINLKVYIGITSQKPELRWGRNGCNYKSSPHFYSAIKKYGWENFSHEIVCVNLTKEQACLKEQELIKQYDSMNRLYGYNQTSGGECCISRVCRGKSKTTKGYHFKFYDNTINA